MSHEYYIKNGNALEGPFDLVMMTRKIRNNQLSQESYVQTDKYGSAVPAREISELLEVFHAGVSNTAYAQTNYDSYTLKQLFDFGWNLLSKNVNVGIMAGAVIVLPSVIAAATTSLLPLFSAIVTPVLFACGTCLMSILLLRVVRKQLVTPEIASENFQLHWKFIVEYGLFVGLCSAGIFITLAALINPFIALLILLPGSLVILASIFAPFVRYDNPDMDTKSALKDSWNLVKTLPHDTQISLCIMILAHLALGMLILPLFLSLPILYSAAAEIYEHHIA